MTSTCISNCVKDARVPVRATYVNLYKWPESDLEFIRSLSSDKRKTSCTTGLHHPKVVDSISCRQLYLRSYTFSRDECNNKNNKKNNNMDDDDDDGDGDGGGNEKKSSRTCRSIRDSVAESTKRRRKSRNSSSGSRRRRHEINGRSTKGGNSSSSGSSTDINNNGGGRRRKCEGIRRAKEASCAALAAIFRRLLYCTTKIDVVR